MGLCGTEASLKSEDVTGQVISNTACPLHRGKPVAWLSKSSIAAGSSLRISGLHRGQEDFLHVDIFLRQPTHFRFLPSAHIAGSRSTSSYEPGLLIIVNFAVPSHVSRLAPRQLDFLFPDAKRLTCLQRQVV